MKNYTNTIFNVIFIAYILIASIAYYYAKMVATDFYKLHNSSIVKYCKDGWIIENKLTLTLDGWTIQEIMRPKRCKSK